MRLEVDTGARRTGVTRGHVLELAGQIAALPHLNLTGIYTFKSLVLHGCPTEDNKAAAVEEAELMSGMAASLRTRGLPIREVSAGSTPYRPSSGQDRSGYRGTPRYLYLWGLDAHKENCAAVEDIAVRLYAMVVSTPAPDYAVLDGGTKTFPMDIPLDTPPFLYPGYAIPIGGDGKPDENLQLRRMNEEHGILTAKNGRTGLRVGQSFGADSHSCLYSGQHAEQRICL